MSTDTNNRETAIIIGSALLLALSWLALVGLVLTAVYFLCPEARWAGITLAWEAPTNNKASSTSAPTGTVTETLTLSNLASTTYRFAVRAVAQGGAKSDNSNTITNRLGKPTPPGRVR